MDIGESENALLGGNGLAPISYEWAFRILKGNYQEQEGAPIVRIKSQLSSIDRAIYIELEQGVRNPGGISDWLVEKRNGLKASGRDLTNREIYSSFGDCIIVKNQKLADVIRRHCLITDFIGDLEETVSDTFHVKFPNSRKGSEDPLNPDATEYHLRVRMFTMFQQYRLRPTRFQALYGLRIKITICGKVKV